MDLGKTPIEHGKNRTRTSQDGMTLDDISNAMPSKELKEWNEKNLEGRVERSC